MGTSMEMPKYKCHKEVWGLRIADIHFDGGCTKLGGNVHALLIPTDVRYAPIEVDREYVEKHKPEVGGYYVIYEGGYKSFSPADAFESGYSAI